MTPMQRSLLAAAAARDDHMLVPPADMAPGVRASTSARMIAAGLAQAYRVPADAPEAWRPARDGEGEGAWGLRATDAGLAAVRADAPAEEAAPPAGKAAKAGKGAKAVSRAGEATAARRAAKAGKPAPAPEPAKATKPGKASKGSMAAEPPAKRATGRLSGKPTVTTKSLMAAAAEGVVPAAPDFSAETHKRFRARLADLVAMVEARDVRGLRAVEIKPVSSSPKALARYRDAAVLALEVQAKEERAAKRRG